MNEQNSLLKRIVAIETRNKRVELDKKWEGSYARYFLILICTYVTIGLYMWAIGVSAPLLNALIPALGFTLSTLSFPFFKEIWIRHQK